MAQQDQSGVSPQAISLPSGPGSMEGLGEKFQPQVNTGAFTYQIPLKLPPMRGGAPSLALEYNPGNENGMLGLGWALRMPCVQRQTDKGLPQYIPTDFFCDENAEELVHLADGSYRQKIEGLFIRYQQTSNGGWIGNLPNGTLLTFGSTEQSRLNWSTNGTFCWMIDSSQDPNGNLVEYFYTHDSQYIYPSEILYGLHATQASSYFSVQFGYSSRPDPFVDCRPRFASTNALRLNSMTVFFGSRRIRQWQFGYSTNSTVSLLSSVTEFGADPSLTNAAAQVNVDYLPPTQFGYTPFVFTNQPALQTINFDPQEKNFSFDNEGSGGQAEFVDINHDGLPDILINSDNTWRSLINPGRFTNAWPLSQLITNPPPVTGGNLGHPGVRLVDLNGDGKAKLMLAQDEADTDFNYYDFLSPTTLGPAQIYETENGISIADTEVQFVDLDDDKAMDVLRLDPDSGFLEVLFTRNYVGEPNVYGVTNMPAGVQFDFTQGWQLADINGDHVLDFVQLNGTDNTEVCLNLGWGNFAPPYFMTGGPDQTQLQTNNGTSRPFLVDINEDGLADLVIVENGDVEIWFNDNGTNWVGPFVVENTPAYEEGQTAIRFADIDGNGSTDIIWHQNQDTFITYADFFPSGKAYLLNEASTTLGRTLNITYANSTDFLAQDVAAGNPWTNVAPFTVPVMSQVIEGDGLGDFYTNEFAYENDYFDPIQHQFRGFDDATQTELGDDSQGAPTLVTQFQFSTGDTNEALTGKTLRIETDTDTGEVFYRQTNTWIPRPLNLPTFPGETRIVTFAYESDELTEEVELGPETDAITLERAFNYDDFGNQIYYADYGEVVDGNQAAGNDERLYLRQFSAEFPSGTNLWLLNRLVEQQTTDINSNVVAKAEIFYDDPSFAGNNPGVVSLGNPTLTRDWINISKNTYRSTVRMEYDAFGNVTGMYDPLGVPRQPAQGHYRQIAFDPQIHTHPVTETIYTANPDAVAAGNSQPSLLIQASYDVGLGVMTSAMDFNQNTTRFGFDTFGRIVSITKPYDTTNLPTAAFTYMLQSAATAGQTINYIEADLREVSGQSGIFASRDFFDGLGRKMMTRTQSESNGVVVVGGATLFNQRRSVWHSFLPYFETGTLAFNSISQSVSYVETDYDALGRATAKSQPPTPPEAYRAFSQTTYGPLTRLVRDEEQTQPSSPHYGAGMLYVEDGLRGQNGHGRLRQVEEIVHLFSTGQATGNTNIWLTQYNYDTLDDFLGYIDSQGNQKFFQYDALMRKTFMNDPDRGVMQWYYDPASNVTNTMDAKGQEIGYTYDGANRLLTETYFNGRPMPPWRPESVNSVIYHYDLPYANVPVGDGTVTTAQNTLGKLAWVEDLSGEEHTSYDARGRVTFTIKRLPDPEFLSATNAPATSLISYQTAFQYDSLDRTTQLTYPDGDAIGYTYNQRNLLSSIQGGVNSLTQAGEVIQGINYMASSQLGSILYGNGILTQYAYDPRLRLSSITTAPAGNQATPLIAFGYVFDDVSNIKTIYDNRPTSVVAAGDPRRNTQIFSYDDLYRITFAGYALGAPGDVTPDGGTISYAYDRIGNMLAQTSTFTNTDPLTDLPSVNLGQMSSGGSAGTGNRIGRATVDPPGPHALTEISNSQSPITNRIYAYDSNGNMTDIDGSTNTWDFKDRLIGVENSQIRATYLYDYAGRRTIKMVFSKTPAAQPTNVLYINKYFEVREYDQPTKFVWNGNTRVARVIGSLSGNQRVQRVRLWPGMNLVSIVVDSASLPIGMAAAYQWNAESLSWQSVFPGSPLAAGTVLWIQAASNATITFSGTYVDPAPYGVNAGFSFLASTGLEAFALSNLAPQLSTNDWSYDAENQAWQMSLTVPFTNVNVVPPVLPPGEVLTVRADAAAQITTPDSTLRVRYYHQDHLGSSSVLTDSSGGLLEECALYPFGQPRVDFKPRLIAENYKFTHKERDQESGLQYFEARFHSDNLARFVCIDPLAGDLEPEWRMKPQKMNLYIYCENNPIVNIDPSGTQDFLANLDLSPDFDASSFDVSPPASDLSSFLPPTGPLPAPGLLDLSEFGAPFYHPDLKASTGTFSPSPYGEGASGTVAPTTGGQGLLPAAKFIESHATTMINELFPGQLSAAEANVEDWASRNTVPLYIAGGGAMAGAWVALPTSTTLPIPNQSFGHGFNVSGSIDTPGTGRLLSLPTGGSIDLSLTRGDLKLNAILNFRSDSAFSGQVTVTWRFGGASSSDPNSSR
jgi:RHS repeat-associated protein